jgi:tRNA A-37 threonylcarbamoyl transferase component Bud32
VRRRLGWSGELTATPLDGGVSSDIWLVTGGARDVVVKRSLPRLRVREDWRSTPERVLTEAAALRLAGQLSPERVPALVDVDPATLTVVMERAPADWRPWKSVLMAGEPRAEVAGRLGADLAAWHAGTVGEPARTEFADQSVFDELRVGPFYRFAAARNPAVEVRVRGWAEAMADRRLCLVHGDFSPKNVLVGGGSASWVLDWEVAHYGDPVFDVAFMLCHLLLKSVHRPKDAWQLWACADAFLAAYRAGVPTALVPPTDHMVGHVGCLLLARVDGKSPAEYLSDAGREHVRDRALAALSGDVESVDALWKTFGEPEPTRKP